MSSNLTRQFRHRFGAIGLAMAMLALVCHFALAAILLPATDDPLPQAELDALTILCNQPAPHHHHDPAPHPTGGHDCVCPLSLSASLHAVLLGSAPLLRAPLAIRGLRLAAELTASAAPRASPLQPYPTGPPVLL